MTHNNKHTEVQSEDTTEARRWTSILFQGTQTPARVKLGYQLFNYDPQDMLFTFMLYIVYDL